MTDLQVKYWTLQDQIKLNDVIRDLRREEIGLTHEKTTGQKRANYNQRIKNIRDTATLPADIFSPYISNGATFAKGLKDTVSAGSTLADLGVDLISI